MSVQRICMQRPNFMLHMCFKRMYVFDADYERLNFIAIRFCSVKRGKNKSRGVCIRLYKQLTFFTDLTVKLGIINLV